MNRWALARWAADHRLAAAGIAGGLVIVVLATAATISFLSARSTSAPSLQEAIKAFRAQHPSPPSLPSLAGPASDGGPPSPAAGTPPAPTGPMAPTSPGPTPSPSPSGRTSVGQPRPSAAASPCGWDCPYQGPPAAGVYQWFQCGRTSGECTGDPSEPQAMETINLLVPITRALPRTGVRTITVTGPNQWHLAHAYANEHQEDFDLSGDASGIYSISHTLDISVLGIDNTTTIAQTPPFPAILFPLAVGKTWSGHWTDANGNANGDYTVTVLGKPVLSVGGQPVQTWLVDWRFKLLGPKTTGDVDYKAWVAPRYSQSVQEFETETLTSNATSYQATWMITLASLQPSR